MRCTRTAMKTTTKTWIVALVLAFLATSASAQGHATRGYLFIVGGGPQPPALVQRFVDLAGGKKAKIVVFAMASSDGKASGVE